MYQEHPERVDESAFARPGYACNADAPGIAGMRQQAVEYLRGRLRVRWKFTFDYGNRPRKNHTIPAKDSIYILFQRQTSH
jgi:hypothetical protein